MLEMGHSSQILNRLTRPYSRGHISGRNLSKQMNSPNCSTRSFRCAGTGENSQRFVTPAAFEIALRKLGQDDALSLDRAELDHLVKAFDSERKGIIDMEEFVAFCLGIPTLPWRAERARR